MSQVLVVEDDENILNLIRLHLRKAGHRVAAVSNPREALELVETAPPGLAILDVGLPGMTGFQLLRELRERPGLGAIPAIFLSARVEEQDIATGRALGAVYLTKPFVGSALVNAVESALAELDENQERPGSADPYQ